MVIRLVVKERDWANRETIVSVYEMQRHRKDGKRDIKGLERLLDLADMAIQRDLIPTFEFLKEVT